MEISDIFAWRESSQRKNAFFLPRCIRGLIVGSSNSGKTVLLINLLLSDALDYNRLFLYARSLHQPQYRILIKGFQRGLTKKQLEIFFHQQLPLSQVEEIIDNYDGLIVGDISVDSSDDITTIPDPTCYDEKQHNLVIFDDCALEKQNNIYKHFTRGRQNNLDIFYLSQNFFLLDRRTIRSNSNIFFIFEQNSKNLLHIYSDLASQDMSFIAFTAFCKQVWEQPYTFVTIDPGRPVDLGRYRRNLNEYYSPTAMNFQKISSLEEEEKLIQEINNLKQKIGKKRKNDERESPANIPRNEQSPRSQSDNNEQSPCLPYQSASNLIPKRKRDTGVLGLSVNGKIGPYAYSISGNILQVAKNDEVENFTIHHPNTWIILLAKNPEEFINLKDKHGKNAVDEYQSIIKKLELPNNKRNRSKFSLASGHGLHAIMIPSNKQQLLKLLFRNLSEFRAGNYDLKECVIPLAREAIRRKILPDGVLTEEELTWTYY